MKLKKSEIRRKRRDYRHYIFPSIGPYKVPFLQIPWFIVLFWRLCLQTQRWHGFEPAHKAVYFSRFSARLEDRLFSLTISSNRKALMSYHVSSDWFTSRWEIKALLKWWINPLLKIYGPYHIIILWTSRSNHSNHKESIFYDIILYTRIIVNVAAFQRVPV